MPKSIHTIHQELGFVEGKHFRRQNDLPGGYSYTDEAVLGGLYVYVDQIADRTTREYIKQRIEGAKGCCC